MRQFYVYVMGSKSGVLYVGMTNNLARRIHEHKTREVSGFTKRYHVTRLVYAEDHQTAADAIAREKQIKAWRRSKKLDLVRSQNPKWLDLAETLVT
jgi:putative endonuclease